MYNVLLVDTARGIYFPTLWKHIYNLGGNEVVLGFCVGAFSFGRRVLVTGCYARDVEQN